MTKISELEDKCWAFKSLGRMGTSCLHDMGFGVLIIEGPSKDYVCSVRGSLADEERKSAYCSQPLYRMPYLMELPRISINAFIPVCKNMLSFRQALKMSQIVSSGAGFASECFLCSARQRCKLTGFGTN